LQQKKHQQRQNPQLFRLVAKLWEKIDDLKTTKFASSDYKGEENSSPIHDG
jgi:hypothetical protein